MPDNRSFFAQIKETQTQMRMYLDGKEVTFSKILFPFHIYPCILLLLLPLTKFKK